MLVIFSLTKLLVVERVECIGWMVRNLICETGSIREGFFDLIPRFAAVLEYAARRKLGRLEVALRDLFVFPLERVRIRGRVGLGAELVRA